MPGAAATPVRPALSHNVDNDGTHDAGGVGEEMRPVRDVEVPGVQQSQIGFMHEHRGVEMEHALVAPEPVMGDLVQLLVEQRTQLGDRRTVTLPRRVE